TEVLARIESATHSTNPVSFSSARASFEQTTDAINHPYKAWTAASVIDNDAKGDSFGWAIFPQTNLAHQIVLQLAQPLNLSAGETLILQLKQNHGESDTLAHFRVA